MPKHLYTDTALHIHKHLLQSLNKILVSFVVHFILFKVQDVSTSVKHNYRSFEVI